MVKFTIFSHVQIEMCRFTPVCTQIAYTQLCDDFILVYKGVNFPGDEVFFLKNMFEWTFFYFLENLIENIILHQYNG